MIKDALKRTLQAVGFALLCGTLTNCINFKPHEKAEEKEDEEEIIKSNAQDDAEMAKSNHLKFKGVPIDGPLELFVERMERKGFLCNDMEDGRAVLNGDFAGSKNCRVFVETLDGKDLVSRIKVAFPPKDQWKYLYGDYKYLKDLLTEKYGEPASCKEVFKDSYGSAPSDDNDKMHSAMNGECEYKTCYVTDKGEVVLAIEGAMFSCDVVLVYKDKANGSIIEEHIKGDL